MNVLKIANKVVKLAGKPVSMFFGSDERGFMTLLGVTILLYFSGFPHAATVVAVYSAMFGYAGMQAYNTSNSSSSSDNEELEEIENMMEDALGMAQEFQQQSSEGEKE